jgi:aspartate/methionine/tyrosine aminotransferase
MAKLKLSSIVQEQMKKPSPIRQIMKMADRQNIINMGLDPDDIISFGGGWVNHAAPKELQEKYIEICKDSGQFHASGGYSATLGDLKCREQLARYEQEIFGVKELTAENIIIGQSSTQLTHDVFRTLADPNDEILLLDPTYANYYGQIIFALHNPGVKIKYLPVLDPIEWKYLPNVDEVIDKLQQLFTSHKFKIVLFPAPDNPTSQILPEKLVKSMVDIAADNNAYVIIDYAYKTQYFGEMPRYFSWSPNDYENLVALHSNSKWARGLGRRLGWIEAHEEVIDGLERVQQCSILCPDSLHQMAIGSYLEEAIDDGSLRKYVDEGRRNYQHAADVTIKAIDKELGMPRLIPQGGLYTVMDAAQDANEFVLNVLKNTGVLFIPGIGFGNSLKNGVRISYGPLVNDVEKIKEGMERVGRFLKK